MLAPATKVSSSHVQEALNIGTCLPGSSPPQPPTEVSSRHAWEACVR